MNASTDLSTKGEKDAWYACEHECISAEGRHSSHNMHRTDIIINVYVFVTIILTIKLVYMPHTSHTLMKTERAKRCVLCHLHIAVT